MNIPISDRQKRVLAEFTGRTWLLPVLFDWLANQPDERIFLLTGEPGSGKSMISAWLARGEPAPSGAIDSALWDHLDLSMQPDEDYSSLWSYLRTPLLAGHFCQSMAGNSSPRLAAESISKQIASALPAYDQALQESLKELVQMTVGQKVQTMQTGSEMVGAIIKITSEEKTGFDRVLRKPLLTLYENGFTEPLLILIDALDEALVDAGAVNLVTLLARLDDLPPEVRFLITTRPLSGVLSLFPTVPTFDLIKNPPPEAAADLPDFLTQRLKNVSPEQRTTLISMITEAAEGNFLYAQLVVNDLLNRPSLPSDLTKLKLPKKLIGLYHEFLNRQVGTNRAYWDEQLKPVLGLVSVGQGTGFTANQLSSILGRSITTDLDTCRPYLDGNWNTGPFKIFHKSFLDFLLIEPKNTDYHIEAAEMHARVADWLCPDTFAERLGYWSDYEKRYAITHLAGAVPFSAGNREYLPLLLDAVVDPTYKELYKMQFNDLVGMQANLEQALNVVVTQTYPQALPGIVQLVLELVKFRKEELQPNAVFDLARKGRLDQAERRLALFDTDPEWLIVSRLAIAWSGAAANPNGAQVLRQRIADPMINEYPLDLLAARLDAALAGQAEPELPALPLPPNPDEARELVLRLAGQPVDSEMLKDYAMKTGAGELLMPHTRDYASKVDGPPLVAFTLQYPKPGSDLFQQYINLHTSYDYAEYRRKSLWWLLHAVVRHPNPEWVLTYLPKICAAALVGRRLDYQQGVALTVMALRAAAGGQKATDLQAEIDKARKELQQLQGSRRQGDTYGRRQRRLVAIAQAKALLLNDPDSAASLLAEALDTSEHNFGLAGFQFATSLAINEAFLVCKPEDTNQAQQALDYALVSAQNITDTSFCARSKARVNTIQHHWKSLTTNELIQAVDQLRDDPLSQRFSTLHLTGQDWKRDPGTKPLDSWFSKPETLADLARAYNQSPEELERLNRPQGLTLKSSLDGILEVYIPDPGFATFLASRFSAFVLCNPDLGWDMKIELLQKLVPIAAPNPTILDIVLSRLLIAHRPIIPDIFKKLEDLTRPYLPMVEEDNEQINIPS